MRHTSNLLDGPVDNLARFSDCPFLRRPARLLKHAVQHDLGGSQLLSDAIVEIPSKPPSLFILSAHEPR